jgi:hypothetical protein
MNGLATIRAAESATDRSRLANAPVSQSGLGPGVGPQAGPEFVVGDGHQPAPGVLDQDDLGRAQQSLADGQRPDDVRGDDAAGVPEHVGVAVAQPEQSAWIQPRVHARTTATRMAGRPGGS